MTDTKNTRQLIQVADNPLQEAQLNIAAQIGGPVTYSLDHDVYAMPLRWSYDCYSASPSDRTLLKRLLMNDSRVTGKEENSHTQDMRLDGETAVRACAM